jgi:hypothetical protein
MRPDDIRPSIGIRWHEVLAGTGAPNGICPCSRPEESKDYVVDEANAEPFAPLKMNADHESSRKAFAPPSDEFRFAPSQGSMGQ